VPSFEYTALNPSGQRVAGVLNSPSEQAVLAELESRRLTPVKIEAQAERAAGRSKVGHRALGTAYGQLADLLRAGVPLLRCLRLLGQRKSTPVLSAIFREIADEVASGEDLAGCMAKRPEAFPPIHVAMVRAGERGGFLEEVLSRISRVVLAQAELQGKVMGNLIYPAALLLVGTSAILVIFGFFVPMFRPLFEEMRLPWYTSAVLAVSDIIRAWGLLILGGLVVGWFVGWRLLRRPDVQAVWQAARTRMPVLGPLTRALAAARFCRMLGTMLENGVPMLGAMQISREAAGNILLERAIEEATEAVRSGEALAPPLARSGLFEDDIIEMISVGESANNLGSVLMNIADTLEQRVDRLLSGAVRLVEPLLLVLMALVIGTIAASLIVPMTSMSGRL
jgi:general secretion pathway protein F